jgi:hypothetical protein
MKFTIRLKGGLGSGHHGHKGIPGHHGGSLPSGSLASAIVDRPRVLPDTNYVKLSEGTSFYHVTRLDNLEDIMSKGLLSSSKVAKNSNDNLVEWAVDHPVDGVFLGSFGQAQALMDQFEGTADDSAVMLDVYLPKGTIIYQDPMMPESSIQVEGDIPVRRIRKLTADYKPYKDFAQERIDTAKWKLYKE